MRAVPARIHLPRAGQEPAVKRAHWLVTASLAALAACARLPDPSPPPAQRAQPQRPLLHYALTRERSADERIVAGIDTEIHDDWRWAGKDAELRYSVEESQGIQFEVVLTVTEEFVRAGGSRIDVLIDRKPLGSIPANQAGYQAWKHPVPEEWLAPGRDIRVELKADAEWRHGDERRGYVLRGAGFTL